MKITGKTVVHGIGIGKCQILNKSIDKYLDAYIAGSIEVEHARFIQVYEEIKSELIKMIKYTDESEDIGLEIMKAHLAILDDMMLHDSVKVNIDNKKSAPKAILVAKEEVSGLLEVLEDPYLKERALDVRDICNQLINRLLGIEEMVIKENSVLVAYDIEPSIMAKLKKEKVAGIVLGSGSLTSHTIIIARAKGIPTLVGVNFEELFINESDILILDSDNNLLVNPSTELVNVYKLKKEEMEQLDKYYLKYANEPAITKDGRRITVAANISSPDEVDMMTDKGFEGVGLFRTEFIFMDKRELPSEEEQFAAYRYAIENSVSNLCVIRTLDIGGDKPLPSIQQEDEDNPFLGYRAIRICLEEKELYRTQLRSILRASAYGKAAILIPMVININEIIETKEILEVLKKELTLNEIPFDNEIQIGIMVETPASAVMSDKFAQYVDFFSIGTNDLVQYTLAVDRGNQKIAHLYNYFNPSILRLIDMVVKNAHAEGKWVGVCGEMGADPRTLLALLALNVDEISMSPSLVPKNKEHIRKFSTENIDINHMLAIQEPDIMEDYLETVLRQTSTIKGGD